MVSREDDPEVVSSFGDAVEAARVVYWVCARGRVHAGWASPLSYYYEGSVHPTVVTINVVGTDTLEPNCRCAESPWKGWRRRILSQIFGERPWG